MIPPLTEVSTPLAFRVPLASGRSPLEIGLGVAVVGPQVVQPAAKMPLMPSEMTPTRTPVPSTPSAERTWSAFSVASPSLSTEPVFVNP